MIFDPNIRILLHIYAFSEYRVCHRAIAASEVGLVWNPGRFQKTVLDFPIVDLILRSYPLELTFGS